jgi:hypothetical protein
MQLRWLGSPDNAIRKMATSLKIVKFVQWFIKTKCVKRMQQRKWFFTVKILSKTTDPLIFTLISGDANKSERIKSNRFQSHVFTYLYRLSLSILIAFNLLSKNKSRLMRPPWCLYIHPINFWVPEPIFMKLGIYIMAPEPISMAYFINSYHHSPYPSNRW